MRLSCRLRMTTAALVRNPRSAIALEGWLKAEAGTAGLDASATQPACEGDTFVGPEGISWGLAIERCVVSF
jgi:hypothetical protein